MKCYKVVTARYKSCIVSEKEYFSTNTSTFSRFDTCQILDNPYCVTYKLNKLIKSYNNTSLFCFKNLKSALNFTNKAYGNTKILECEGYRKTKTPKRLSWFTSESMLDLFYKKKVKNKDCYFQYIDIPDGTICFKEVKPIKEVV